MQRTLYLVAALLFAAGLAGAALGAAGRHLEPTPFAIAGVLVILLGMAAAVPLWRRFDEVSREAHKAAWCYGGQIGMAFGCGLLLWALRAGAGVPAGLALGQAPGGFVVFGIVAVLGLQILGYALFWAGWWLARR